MPGDWRQEAARRQKEKQSKGRFKLAEGENVIRVLPNKKGADRKPFFEYFIHRDVGPDKRMVRCGKKITGEGDCWLCDKVVPKLRASDNRAKRAQAEGLTQREQFIVQVAVLDGDGKFRGPFLWYVPAGGGRSMSAKLLGVLKSTKRDYVDPKRGYNLNIERTGTQKNDTTYGPIIPDDEPSKVPDSILAQMKAFGDMIPQYTEEAQKAAFFGREEAAAEPEPEPEAAGEEEPLEEGVGEEGAAGEEGAEEFGEGEEGAEDAPRPKKAKAARSRMRDEESGEEPEPLPEEEEGEYEPAGGEEAPFEEEGEGEQEAPPPRRPATVTKRVVKKAAPPARRR